MLLAVEGGGFFSSSASGYSKGLTLLFLGQKKEDKPMRVSPWNQYQLVDKGSDSGLQLVDEGSDSGLQLASLKNRFPCGCTSFVCFGRPSAGLGPTQQKDVLPETPVSDNSKDHTPDIKNDDSTRNISLQSNLKKPSLNVPATVEEANDCEALNVNGFDIAGHIERRKVQWKDTCGSELVEIREFEPSEVDESDDEFESRTVRSCACTIM